MPSPISAHHQPHSCLLFSPSLWRHHHPRYPEQDGLPGCVGLRAQIYPQNLPDSLTPSLFKQLCRANEGRGRHIGEGKPPSSHQALNSEHTRSILCRPERAMHLPAEGAHKATPSSPHHTSLSLACRAAMCRAAYSPCTQCLSLQAFLGPPQRDSLSAPTCTHPAPLHSAQMPSNGHVASRSGAQVLEGKICHLVAVETRPGLRLISFIINTEFTSFASE